MKTIVAAVTAALLAGTSMAQGAPPAEKPATYIQAGALLDRPDRKSTRLNSSH